MFILILRSQFGPSSFRSWSLGGGH